MVGSFKWIKVKLWYLDCSFNLYRERIGVLTADGVLKEMKDLIVEKINYRYKYEVYYAKELIFFYWI